jgi:hypothetical protein
MFLVSKMIKIFVNNDISPEFIEPQLASFQKYLKEDFEYTICGGETVARKPDKAREVTEVCRTLGVPIIEIKRNETVMSHCNEFGGRPRSGQDEQIFTIDRRYQNNIQASYATQWTWEEVISKQQGLVCYLHSDVFLMEPIKISDYLKKYDLCSVIIRKVQTDGDNVVHAPLMHLHHLWETLMFLNMSRLPEPETLNWWGGRIEGTWMPDGGGTYFYLKAHPELNILEIEPSGYDDDPATDFHPSRYQFLLLKDPEIGEKKIFHYMAGCRWATDQWQSGGVLNETSDEYHAKKLAWTRKLIGL